MYILVQMAAEAGRAERRDHRNAVKKHARYSRVTTRGSEAVFG